MSMEDVARSVSQIGHIACVLKTTKELMLPNYKTIDSCMCCLQCLNAALLPKSPRFPSKSVDVKCWWPLFSVATCLHSFGTRLSAGSPKIGAASANTKQAHGTVGSQANVWRQSAICSGSSTTLVFL